MKRRLALAGLLFVAAAFIGAHQASTQGMTVLFDGKSIDNFNKVGDANWRIEDGAERAGGEVDGEIAAEGLGIGEG